MRLCYVLLSPTFGMHQYTADLANRLAQAGHDVHLVTTTQCPRDRYAPAVTIHTPVETTNSGFSFEALRLGMARRAAARVGALSPDVVHCTGPHPWNTPLILSLQRQGIPTIHTLHDLHPHAGAAYGRLLYLWNGWIRRAVDLILVHGRCYQDEFLAQGVAPSRLAYTPLTHLFLSHARQESLDQSMPQLQLEPFALFLGRLEVYKGLEVLFEAARCMGVGVGQGPDVVVAGQGRLDAQVQGSIPEHVEVRNRLIADEEALDLFTRCGLVVLPYIEASQSALVAAAYYFGKPVIVTRVGALPEYVVEGETGWVIPPDDPQALADTLQGVLQDPERLARMGRAGRRWYERQRQAEWATLQGMYADLIGARVQDEVKALSPQAEGS